MMASEMVLTHKWEEKGLGRAPFRLVGFFSFPSPSLAEANVDAYNAACRESSDIQRAFGVSGGICNVCGMTLMNNYVIRGADGGCFVVGCDCVLHTGDSRLISAVEKQERARQRELRRARTAAKWEAARQAREAQRADHTANHTTAVSDCTWCRAEEQERQRAAAARVNQDRYSAANKWLIDVLRAQAGGFCQDVSAYLMSHALDDLSDRQITVARDIYARAMSGRRSGAQWQAAADEFDGHLAPIA